MRSSNVRLLYEPDDEEEFEQARDLLIADFDDRRDPSTPEVSPFIAQCGCDYRFETGDGLLGRWSEALVQDFLLEFMVRKVTLAPQDRPGVVPGLCAWFGYLGESGTLDPRGATARQLTGIAQGLGARVADALDDPEQWGLAKFWATTALERGVDLQDAEALERFVAGARDGSIDVDEELVRRISQQHQERAMFELLGFEPGRRGAYSAEIGPRTPPQLPVALTPRHELAEDTRRITALEQLRAFVDWVGESRSLTQRGALRAADAREAATATAAETGTGMDVAFLLEWALASRLVKVRKGELSKVKSAAADLRDPVKLWTRAFCALPRLGEELLPGDSILGLRLDEVLPDLLAALYSMEEPSNLLLLRTSVRQAAAPAPFPGLAGLELSTRDQAGVNRDFDTLLDLLRTLGAIELYRRGKPDPTVPASSAKAAMLTPLGTYGVHHMLKDLGRHLPVVGELTGAEAAGLLNVVYDEYTSATAAAEIRLWRDARPSPAEADEQLREALRRIPFEERRYGMLHLLFDLHPDGEAFVRTLRADPQLGPLALARLLEAGLERPEDQDPAEMAIVMVDSLAAALTASGPHGLIEALAGTDREVQEALIDTLAKTPHPKSPGLLDAIALHHPDRQLSRCARRARKKAADASRAAGD